MNTFVDLEYYPTIPQNILENDLQLALRNKDNFDEPFFNDIKSYLHFSEINKVLENFELKKVINVIVLGTGGSIQTLLALKHLCAKNIYPITSSRPEELHNCLKMTEPHNSIVIPISRGGETLDINSTIGTFVKKGYPFLGLSSSGAMHDILLSTNAPLLDVPDLAGRFAGSNTNVGIVPALISGVDVKSFLNGLAQGYDLFLHFDDNAAFKIASFLYNLYKKGYHIVFSMPYSKNLEGVTGLFVQEVSESTGKDGKGLMGAYQEAPLCQHSILEFLLGGKKGFVIPTIWTTQKSDMDLHLSSSLKYVDKLPAQTVINYQAQATFQALIEEEVPSIQVSVQDTGARSMGILISFIQSAIYFLCLLLNVNWANNPKVIIGKKICNEALEKRKSLEAMRSERKVVAQDRFKNFY
jgi:glucose-6-phosphate isomerase